MHHEAAQEQEAAGFLEHFDLRLDRRTDLAAARGFGLITAGTAVTLDLNTQFIGGGRVGEPIEAQVEVLKETGRLLFLRGLVVQGDDDTKIAAFSATIRKPSGKPPRADTAA